MKTIRRHQALISFPLAFAISSGGMLILALPGGLPKTSVELDALLVSVFLAMLLGPTLSSLIPTVALDGQAGLRALLAPFGRWRVPSRYLPALAGPAMAFLAAAVALTTSFSNRRAVV